jgi:GSH-dependent disulfide-bond oxidoreductase
MIELHYWPTPNGRKVTMLLEETGLPYSIKLVDLGAGDQFKPELLRISPNNKIPAIIDHSPADGGAPIPIFESGAILMYLAEKTGRFLPAALRERTSVIKWLFWQVGGLGPMAGQNHHFTLYAPEKIPYAVDRYVKETGRLYGVLDRQLDERTFIAGNDYSIADIAAYPWIVHHRQQAQNLDDFPNIKRWFETIQARPATARAYEKGKSLMTESAVTGVQTWIGANSGAVARTSSRPRQGVSIASIRDRFLDERAGAIISASGGEANDEAR